MILKEKKLGSKGKILFSFDGHYHISDMIPIALPPRVAGDGLKDPCSFFV